MRTIGMTPRRTWLLLTMGLAATACRREPPAEQVETAAAAPEGRVLEIRDTTISAELEAAGIAEPIRRATMSTRLMGAVTAVHVREGERVRAGQLLASIDARDVAAKRAQVDAGIAEAEAVHADAVTQATRMRGLYADSAATKAQLDAAETGLARAEAGVNTARAAAREVDAVGAYAQLRAPFAGVVTRRFVDPGAFVAPGAPVVAVEDGSRLRIRVIVAPETAKRVAAGSRLDGTIEGKPVQALVEGVTPLPAGALYAVNALVENARGELPSGGTAMLRLPQGTRTALLVPAAALVREGDLTGVRVRTPTGSELRWVRQGDAVGERVEVLSGLRSGDRVIVPAGMEGES